MNHHPDEPLPAENTACAICGKPVGDEPRIRFVMRHVLVGRMHIGCAPADMSAWLAEKDARVPTIVTSAFAFAGLTAEQVPLTPEQQAAEIEAQHPFYLSTACLHGKHSVCRLTCKFCSVACVCRCHEP